MGAIHRWTGMHLYGNVSEIFDGDRPHHPRGCFAQAWSVAEVLRAIVEHGLAVEDQRPTRARARAAKAKRGSGG